MSLFLIMGPPGSGKGTLAHEYAKKTGMKHVSIGELIRQEIAAGTPLGKEIRDTVSKGGLIEDSKAAELVYQELEEENDVLVDGFPRSIRQAVDLLTKYTISGVIKLHLPDHIIIRRIGQRRVCPRDGSTYHLEFKPPKRPGWCDRCDSRIIQRDDDREETVRNRLETYFKQTKPILTWFEQQHIPIIVVRGDYDLKKEGPHLMEKIHTWQQAVERQ